MCSACNEFGYNEQIFCVKIINSIVNIWLPRVTAYNEQKETVRYKQVLTVTKLFVIFVSDFDAKKSARFRQCSF